MIIIFEWCYYKGFKRKFIFVYDCDEWMIRGWVVSVIECLEFDNSKWSILISGHDL